MNTAAISGNTFRGQKRFVGPKGELHLDQREFRRLLKAHFEKLTQKNPKYSMRAFANRLGLGIGAVSEIMGGKRKVSIPTAQKVVAALKISDRERAKFEATLTAGDVHQRSAVKSENWFLLEHWSYLAILCLFEVDKPVTTPAEILSRLNISEKELQKFLKKLIAADFISVAEDGSLESTRKSWAFGDGVSSKTIRRFHKDSLKLSLSALETVDMNARDFTSLTFAGSSKRLPATRQTIRTSLDRAVESMSRGTSDTVYRLSVQLVPLTNVED